MTNVINNAFMRLSRRAEINDRSKLVSTFVDVGPLFALLSSKDHQVMYGRRGTGKTHALSYLAEQVESEGNIVAYVDMRNIGSSGGIYGDASIPISERATRLLMDTLGELHERLLEFAVENSEDYDLSQTGPVLDKFAEAITEVKVVGSIERERTTAETQESRKEASGSLTSDTKSGVNASIGFTDERKRSNQTGERIKESGSERHTVHFGSVGNLLGHFCELIHPKRIWLMLDEWSHIPLELQPFLADLFRRSTLSVRGITVKIAAIEQRSLFRIHLDNRQYIGLELGADIAADVNLDDFMVFDNDPEKAKDFFQDLLFKHYQAVENMDLNSGPQSAVQLVQQGFTQHNVFEEFVRSSEGVPRDAINIITSAARKAMDRQISMDHVRTGARDWYQRDKAAAATTNVHAERLLHWLIDTVIGERRARAFLLKSSVKNDLIDYLFDARLLHILKRNISARDEPGARYDAYKLDYGCYVDLINTTKATQGLLPLDDQTSDMQTFLDVPPDDYRSIRRAILDLEEFEGTLKSTNKRLVF